MIQYIDLFKQLPADNSRNSTLYNTSLGFIPFYQLFIITKSHRFVTVLYEGSFIDGISYDCQDFCMIPKVILMVMRGL